MNNEESSSIFNTFDNIIDKDEPNYHVGAKSELKHLIKSSIPLLITFGLQYSIYVTAIYACGQLGTQEVAAASLAICSFSITGIAIIQGFATSLDSYCSQTYSSGNITGVGIYFQRCALMMFTLISPLTLIWWFSSPILNLMVPDYELTQLSQTFLRINILSIPSIILFESGKRFLQAQHIFEAGTYILLTVAPINFLLHWLLVWHPTYGLGFIGSPISVTITNNLIPLLMFCYVYFIDGKKCWGGFDFIEATSNWLPMLSLSIPGIIMIVADYFAFEVLTILSSKFGTEAIAAQSITANVISLTFQLPFSVSVAVSTRIGHWLGRENLHAARLVTKLTLGLAITVASLLWITLFSNREFIARIFSKDEVVIEMTGRVLACAAFNQLFGATNAIGAGILRGQGRQKIGSILNLISYYMVGLPLSYIIGFHTNVGFVGLWYGLICGVMFLAIVQTASIYFSNWERILTQTKARI